MQAYTSDPGEEIPEIAALKFLNLSNGNFLTDHFPDLFNISHAFQKNAGTDPILPVGPQMVRKYLSVAFKSLCRCASSPHGHTVERDIDCLYPAYENEPQQILEIGSDFE